MSNAMRSGKRLLAGVAVGALGAALIPFVAAPAAQAAVSTPTAISASQFGPMRSNGPAQNINVTLTGVADDTTYVANLGLVVNAVNLWGPNGGANLSSGGWTLTTATNSTAVTFTGGTATATLTLAAGSTVPAGTYTAFVYAAPSSGASGSGAAFTNQVRSSNFTITVSGAPRTMAISPVSTVGQLGTTATDGNAVAVSLLDSAGRQTSLISGETIALADTPTTPGTFSTFNGGSQVTGRTAVNKELSVADYAAGLVTNNGRLVILQNTAAGLKNISFTPNAILATQVVTPTLTAQAQWVAAGSGAVSSVQVVTPTDAENASSTSTVPAGTTSIVVSAVTTAGIPIPYAATSNAARGTAYFSQNGQVVSNSNGVLTIPMTVPSGATGDGNSITLYLYGSSTVTHTINFSAGVAEYTIASPSTSIVTSAVAGTTPISVAVTDEFGRPVTGAVVTYTLNAGSRNGSATANTVVSTQTTGATGLVTYNLVDSSTSTTNFTDTVSVAATLEGVAVPLASPGFATLIINYGAANLTTLSLVSIGSTDETTATTALSLLNGTADSSRGAFTVFSAPAGVPVTLTAPAGAKISTTASFNMGSPSVAKDTLTLYPGSAGTTVYIGSTKSGANKVTASGPGKTADLTFTFTSPTSAARVLSVTPDKAETSPGTTVRMTAKVVDGWGNPVPGVVLQAAANGIVYFGGGLATQQVTTGTDGTATVIAVSPAVLTGESSVTFTPVTPASTAAQWGSAAGVTIPSFPAGVAVATTAITTKGGAGTKTIVIAGERGTVSGKSGIIVDGATKGFDVGSAMVPNLRFPGETTFTAGSARPTTNAAGDFSWQRKTGKRVTVFFSNEAGDIRSNRVTIQTS